MGAEHGTAEAAIPLARELGTDGVHFASTGPQCNQAYRPERKDAAPRLGRKLPYLTA